MSTANGANGVQTHIQPTSTRVTPPPAGRRFRDALGRGAEALLGGVETAASFVPGGTAVTAAVRGATGSSASALTVAGSPASLPGSAGSTPEAPGATVGSSGGGADTLASALQSQADQSIYYLQLQEQMSAENRRFSALSNVMKARHDTAKTAINNIK